jgi:hypothetical protein
VISIDPPTSPADIWNYATRTLTQKVGIIERVAPRYDSTDAMIYNVTRVVNAGTTFILITDGSRYNVISRYDDNIFPSIIASETIVDANFSPIANVRDNNDSTYATSSTQVAVTTEQELAKWDLGALRDGYIFLNVYCSGYFNTRIYTSADGTTWTKVYDKALNGMDFVYVSGIRYISLRVYNTDTTYARTINLYWKIYELEFFPPNIRKVLSYDTQVTKPIVVFSIGNSQFLEVLNI